MKTPEEIKIIVTRLAGVAVVLDEFVRVALHLSDDDRQAYLRASLYVRDGADLIDELVMATAKPEVEFPEGSLVAKATETPDLYPGRCQMERVTRHGRLRCWSEWRDEKVFPGPDFEGMYGEPVLLKVCLDCAKKEIRWTPEQTPFVVD